MFDKPSSKLFSHSLGEWFFSKKRLQVTKSHNLRHPKQIGNILQILFCQSNTMFLNKSKLSIKNSANNELAQPNHSRVYFEGSSLSNPSCI